MNPFADIPVKGPLLLEVGSIILESDVTKAAGTKEIFNKHANSLVKL